MQIHTIPAPTFADVAVGEGYLMFDGSLWIKTQASPTSNAVDLVSGSLAMVEDTASVYRKLGLLVEQVGQPVPGGNGGGTTPTNC